MLRRRLLAAPVVVTLLAAAAWDDTLSWFENDGWGLRMHAPLDTSSGDIGAITQELARHFQSGIAEHPADWHMLQPQWLADLSAERRARLEGR